MEALENEQAIPKDRSMVSVGTFLLALGGVMLAPLFPNQFISGPIVNAVLFIVTVMLGLRSGILLCFIPSLIALGAGLLPPIFAPFVPFIMLSNIIMVALFHNLRLKNYWLGAGAGSVAKFVFLFAASQIMFNLVLHKALAQNAALMMSWNQLYSAALGAVIAFVFLKVIKRL